MNKDLSVSNLIEVYGRTLSDRALRIMRSYYDLDLSLSEISEEMGITRQGVRDIISRSGDNLFKLERELGLSKKLEEIKGLCINLEQCGYKSIADKILNIIYGE